MKHLTVRVAWHDNGWNGKVCRSPGDNVYCVSLKGIRKDKNELLELRLADRAFGSLAYSEQPPCIAEGGGLMSPEPWRREFRHPYASSKATQLTHGSLKPTQVDVPQYSFFAIPYYWMLAQNSEELEERIPDGLSPDAEAPRGHDSWVFSAKRQRDILKWFHGQLRPKESLCLVYCKEGHPLKEGVNRLLLGVGLVNHVHNIREFASSTERTFPIWDSVVEHSIRPDSVEGFLLPYHDYLEPTGDEDEDRRRKGLLDEITVSIEGSEVRTFSYHAEHASPDVVLSALWQLVDAIDTIRRHGIAPGPWDERLEWVNDQIAKTWQQRGAFPGVGSMLEALGMRLGTAFFHELLIGGRIAPMDDPWSLVDRMITGSEVPPKSIFSAHLAAVKRVWENLTPRQREVMHLLSRFDLSAEQAARWWTQAKRPRFQNATITDEQLLDNPYLLVEFDDPEAGTLPISLSLVDRGLLADSTILAAHPIPERSRIDAPMEWRRVRAAAVQELRRAAQAGDTLLSLTELCNRLEGISGTRPVSVGPNWFDAHREHLAGTIRLDDVVVQPETGETAVTAQLERYALRESTLRKILLARAAKVSDSLGEDWKFHLRQAIGDKYDERDQRHVLAIDEQAVVLEQITTRRLSALVGKAGTGKTSVLGALRRARAVVADGILLLAPTGKARVNLGLKTGESAQTVAQFLYSLKRYDGKRQQPLIGIGDKYRKEKTVVVDECSMMTIDDLAAVLDALDMAHVDRVILVGDPNQLPPIGAGRPFADLVAHLEEAQDHGEDLGRALGKLTVEVRNAASGPSDTLRLASWFTRDAGPVDSDRVLSDVELGSELNDLKIRYWNTTEELHAHFKAELTQALGMSTPNDLEAFHCSLGKQSGSNLFRFDDADAVSAFQVLSPIKGQAYGVRELNRWFQSQFTAPAHGNTRWVAKYGDEEIMRLDKVIQVQNKQRYGYDYSVKEAVQAVLANGEIGMVTSTEREVKVLFSGRPNQTYSYKGYEFPSGGGLLELAFCLTVHKAQGSEFGVVFVVLPKSCALLSRELIYTALTRSRRSLVLLVEGDNISALYDLSRPDKSETARRNTSLFTPTVRLTADEAPYSQNLIHRTLAGYMVRSKSELAIANMLHQMGIATEYERVYEGGKEPGRLRPDFSFVTPAGDIILWEHLGMLDRPDYRAGWEWKREWYRKNGVQEGVDLFTTAETRGGGFDSKEASRVAELIRDVL